MNSKKKPGYFKKKSMRHLGRGDLGEALAVIKAGIEIHPDEKVLRKWLEAIRGYLWVTHSLNLGEKAVSRDDIEDIAADAVDEAINDKMGDIPKALHKSNTCWPIRLDIQREHGIRVYGIRCHDCEKTHYLSDDEEYMGWVRRHRSETGHTRMSGLAFELWEAGR